MEDKKNQEMMNGLMHHDSNYAELVMLLKVQQIKDFEHRISVLEK